MNIQVLQIRHLAGDRSLKAFVDLRIGEWIIHGWRIVKKEGHRAQVSVPQVSWRNPEGKVQYRALLTIPGKLRQRIEVAILSAWEKEKSNEPKNIRGNN